jgi:hypothetical protein
MKKFSRTGMFFLAISLALFITTLQRAYSPISSSFGNSELGAKSWTESGQFFLGPQNLEISFSTAKQQNVSVYLLDTEALEKWHQTRRLTPIVAIENASTQVATYDIPKRDLYTFLIYNPNQTPVNIGGNLTQIGLEKDLLLATIITAIIGIVLMTLQRFIKPADQNKPVSPNAQPKNSQTISSVG